jgi:L-amino acid N-acyltransferase YncA
MLVDGRGADRVARAILFHDVALRSAAMSDADLLLVWANDPETRQASFSRPEIPRGEHLRWLESVLSGNDSRLLVAEQEDRPVGMVRIDFHKKECWISINLAPEARGFGLGPFLLDEAIRLERDRTSAPLRAKILKNNAPSVRCFESAGFVMCDEITERGHAAIVMERSW